MNEDARRKEVEAYLREELRPGRAGERSSASATAARLPEAARVPDDRRHPGRPFGADEIILVISQPRMPGLNPDLKTFWDNETWRNRLMFLCGARPSPRSRSPPPT